MALIRASATPGASVGCHHTPPSNHYGVRGRAFGVSSHSRLCYGSRAKRDRIVPSQATIISIRTRDIRCLISPCKIPANWPYHPRPRSWRWPPPRLRCQAHAPQHRRKGALEDAAIMRSGQRVHRRRHALCSAASPRRMATRARGRTINHVPLRHLWQSCERCWNLATIMQGAKKEREKGFTAMRSSHTWPMP